MDLLYVVKERMESFQLSAISLQPGFEGGSEMVRF
jgi:hypothetical protein